MQHGQMTDDSERDDHHVGQRHAAMQPSTQKSFHDLHGNRLGTGCRHSVEKRFEEIVVTLKPWH